MINILTNSGYSFFSLRKSLVKYLLKKDNVNLYVPNNKKKILNEINSNKLKVFTSEYIDKKTNFFVLILNSIYLLKKIKKNDSNNEIFYIFGTYLNVIYGIISFFINSKKNIYVFTGLGSFFNSNNLLLIFLLKSFFNFLLKNRRTYFVFYNNNDRNFLVKKKFYKKTFIIPGSGIKIKNTNFLKKKKLTNKLKFVFFSRLNYDKGIMELINAIKIVNKKGYDKSFDLNIFGLFDNNPTGLNKVELFNLIKDIKNCFFKEVGYGANLTKIFSKRHIFVLPSHREGLPKTVLEARNFQTALLLSKIPGHNKLINKKKLNGLYFKKKNEIELSKKIILMIKNKKKIMKFMSNSRVNLEFFSTNRVNKKFYEISK